ELGLGRARDTVRRQCAVRRQCVAGLRSQTSKRLNYSRTGDALALSELGTIAPLIETTGFQLRLIPYRLFSPFAQLDRMTRHDRRDRVLVDQLRMSVATQQHAKIVKPCHDALQLDSVDEKDRKGSLALTNVVQEGVL